MKLLPIFATTFILPCVAASAFAARPASWLEGDNALRVASGEAARLQRTVTEKPNRQSAIAWGAFKTAHGDAWRATFDTATGAAVSVLGRGIPSPGSMMSPDAAESAARAVLDQHLDLFAPGSASSDFVLVSNKLLDNMRIVAFAQYHDGLAVVGGQVHFMFKNDRLFVIGSEASPNVDVDNSGKVVANTTAEKAAAHWLKRDYASTLKTRNVEGPMILSLVRSSGAIDHHRVLQVNVDAKNPIARWSVWVDAASGAPVARKQTLMFADGTVLMNAPERWPGDTRIDYPAELDNLTVNAANATTDVNGAFTWAGTDAAQVTMHVVGTRVAVQNDSGAEATSDFTVQPAGTATWNAADQELIDAQLTTFIHAQKGKERAKAIAPASESAWLDDQLTANVNIQDVCNAFSDGETINFFISGRGCENTGRLPDVIHHEFGHTVHAHAIVNGSGNFDSALSEGGADYLAATITNDHGMGRGFFFDNQPLRDVDPPNSERVWPDDINQDPHETGLIYAGAMWDLRTALIAHLGEGPGVEHTDHIWYQVFALAADIPASYAVVIATDDDDGDLSNGTPNICDIDDAFARHGLAMMSSASPGVGFPIANGLTITLPVQSNATCPGTNVQRAELTWQLRRDQSMNGGISMTTSPQGYAATIPAPSMTNEVVQFRLDVTLENGDVLVFPDNAADPFYELYVGEVTPIYCTDFEADPMGGGWTHLLEAGQASQGADDWQWGAPSGTAGSGDPAQAYSGTFVYGNDLGGGNFNGKYQPDKTNALVSPEIDTTGYNIVRLQYRRWLTVEDGFYDHARIVSNNTTVWENVATDMSGGKPHQDKEWRFQDVDLSTTIADSRVQVKFEIESDGGLEFGGWTVDDFCIVGVGDIMVAKCGDGVLQAGEACDDGNHANGDGCSAACVLESPTAACGNGLLEAGEACDDGNIAGGDGCSAACTTESPNATCGNGVVEAGEACDDGVLDGTTCAPGCVMPTGGPMMIPDPSNGLGEAKTSGCGCATTAETKQQELIGSLILLGVLGLSIVLRRKTSR